MVREAIGMDVRESPELLALAEDVKRTGTPRVLRVGAVELARIVPAETRPRRSRGRRTNASDPIWNIVGMADSGAPSNVSEHVDEYLADWEMVRQQRDEP